MISHAHLHARKFPAATQKGVCLYQLRTMHVQMHVHSYWY